VAARLEAELAEGESKKRAPSSLLAAPVKLASFASTEKKTLSRAVVDLHDPQAPESAREEASRRKEKKAAEKAAKLRGGGPAPHTRVDKMTFRRRGEQSFSEIVWRKSTPFGVISENVWRKATNRFCYYSGGRGGCARRARAGHRPQLWLQVSAGRGRG
jgi:hypothetical protein